MYIDLIKAVIAGSRETFGIAQGDAVDGLIET